MRSDDDPLSQTSRAGDLRALHASSRGRVRGPVRGRPWTSGARGLTLIEVLVSLVVLSVGLLGLAGLQVVSVRTTVDSGQRAIATRLATDMAERIRANRAAIPAYLAGATAPAVRAACYSATCSPADRVAMDLEEFRRALAAQLPGGAGVVCRDASPADGTPASPLCSGAATDPLVVKIWWAARDAKGQPLGTAPAAWVLIQP